MRGRSAAIEQAWEAHELAALRGFMLLVGVDQQDIDDCAQEALCRYLERGGPTESAQRAAWLRTTALRIHIDRGRSRSREGATLRMLSPTIRPSTQGTEPVDLRVDLVRALTRLSPKQRIAIALYHLADWPIADVANYIGSSELSARVSLSRARRRLMKVLTQQEEG